MIGGSKVKKIKMFILAFALLFITTIKVNAESAILVSNYSDLQALEESGGVAKLDSDITLTANVILNNLELDLNGHTISTEGYVLIVKGDTVIKDTSSDNKGTIVNSTNSVRQLIEVGKSANLTFESGNIDAKGGYAIFTAFGTTTINGGTISSNSYALLVMSKVILNGGTINGLNGFTVYAYPNSYFEMNGGTVNENGTAQAISLNDGANFIMNGGEVLSPNGLGVAAFKNTYFEINGGKIVSKYQALSGNGSATGTNEGVKAGFKITGGSLTSTSGSAIYAPQIEGISYITGGTITGYSAAIEIRAGILNISGGTLISNAKETSVKANGSGTTVVGSAVALSQHTTKQPIEVNITGGTFKAFVPVIEVNPQKNDKEDISKVKLNISGGTFETTEDGTAIYSEDLTEFVSGGTFSNELNSEYLTSTSIVEEVNKKYVVKPNTVIETKNEKVTFESEEAFSNEYVLVAEEIPEEEVKKVEEKVVESYKNEEKIKEVKLLALYDINVLDSFDTIVPMENGNFTIKIALNENLAKYDGYKVVYIDDEGKVSETLDAKLVDGNIVFTTTHLSTYGIVGYNNVVEENPNTGDNFGIYLIIGLLSILIGSIAFNKLRRNA